MLSLVAATVAAYPWFLAALRSIDEDGRPPPFELVRFADQTVAALFFWGGVLFGLRYLFGLPAIVVALLYAFFGYAVADEQRRRAMRALGWSVHIGQGRRLKILALGLALGALNLFALSVIGAGLNPITVAIAGVLVIVTANMSIVAGARLYRALEAGVGA